jgi:clan AA aspartic protease (TIGR02281 family)
MKYIILLLIFATLPFTTTIGQTDSSFVANGVEYHCFIIKADSTNLSLLNIVSNTSNLNHSDFIQEYAQSHGSNFFAINACVNDNTGKPLGLFIVNNRQKSPINTDDGTGNFFIKPNGALLIKQKDISIIQSDKFSAAVNVVNGVQSGPMLLINDTINAAFNPTSSNKNIRCGVGIFFDKKQEYLLFMLAADPVSFYDFATVFKNMFRCKNALCLESANSVLYSPNNSGNLATNKVVGNYIIYTKATSASTPGNVVRMVKTSSGIYEIPVEINDVLKISFILDPGASDVSISPDVALTLIRTGTVSDSDFVGTQRYVFADGSTAVSNVFIIRRIKIGNTIIKNVRASISNSLDAPMLLGQSVLQKFGKFVINNIDHTITIN